MSLTKHNSRLTHADGTFADILSVQFKPQRFRFLDINLGDTVQKLREIGHFCYFRAQTRGETHPVIVSSLRLEADQPAEKLFPSYDLFSEQGECLLSANSLITYNLRKAFHNKRVIYQDSQWEISSDAPQIERAVIGWLKKTNRLHLYTGPDSVPPSDVDFPTQDFNATKNLAPIDRCGTVSDFVARHPSRLAFNTTFFLLEHEDYFSHHSGLGEAFNLWVNGGIIKRPPLYRRGAIFGHVNANWQIGSFDLSDVAITLPGKIELFPKGNQGDEKPLSFVINKPGQAPVTLYTRYFGVVDCGRVIGKTPTKDGVLELTIVDRRVVSWKNGGDLDVPQNGFVISFSPGSLSVDERREMQKSMDTDIRVSYRFVNPQYAGITEALQVGPILRKDGQSQLLNHDVERTEQLWPSRVLPDGAYQIGVVPTDYDREGLHRRHARTALGIAPSGELILIMAAGVSKGAGKTEFDSQGVSLVELADLFRDAGAVHAVNLDGGGSSQANFYGGRAFIPGERRGLPQVHFERPIPSIGVLE
jgi:hypothetical protein